MRRLETMKRIIVLWLSFFGLLIQTAIYAYIWLDYYYPIVNNFNRGLKFYQNGHLLIIAIYFILLFFFTQSFRGLKIGFLKTMGVFFFPDVFTFDCKYNYILSDFADEQ